jgi:hypothetical protein
MAAKKPLANPDKGGAAKKLVASLGMGRGALKTLRSLSAADRANLLGLGATKWAAGEHKGESMVQRTLKNTMHARKAAGMKPTTGEKPAAQKVQAPISGERPKPTVAQKGIRNEARGAGWKRHQSQSASDITPISKKGREAAKAWDEEGTKKAARRSIRTNIKAGIRAAHPDLPAGKVRGRAAKQLSATAKRYGISGHAKTKRAPSPKISAGTKPRQYS